MSKKVLYFTAGPVPTSAENAAVVKLNALAASQYEVLVLNGKPQARLASDNVSAVANGNYYQNLASSITATDIAAVASDNSITDASSGFIDAGFKVGDKVTTSGFATAANNATRTATIVAAGKITFGLPEDDTLVNESATPNVTVSAPGRFLAMGFAVGQHVGIRGFTTTANNIADGVVTAVETTKLTIGGTDGDGIADEAVGDDVVIETIEAASGYGSKTITTDYVCGTVPRPYYTSNTLTSPVAAIDPDDPPQPLNLPVTQTVITSGDTIEVDGAEVTVTVAEGAVSAATVSDADGVMVMDEDVITGVTVTGSGTTATVTVASGAITAIVLSSGE